MRPIRFQILTLEKPVQPAGYSCYCTVCLSRWVQPWRSNKACTYYV